MGGLPVLAGRLGESLLSNADVVAHLSLLALSLGLGGPEVGGVVLGHSNLLRGGRRALTLLGNSTTPHRQRLGEGGPTAAAPLLT